MKRTGLILLTSGFWLLVSGYYTNTHAQDETLEIITYYPAPYGVYRELRITAGTSGDAIFTIEADTDNSNENDNPVISFLQDGGTANAFIALEGNAGTRSTNTLANAFVIGSEDNDPALQFVTNDSTRMTILTNGNVGIGTNNPIDELVIGTNLSGMGAGIGTEIMVGNPVDPSGLYMGQNGSNFINMAWMSSTGYGRIYTSGGPLELQQYGGNVGIGISPTAKLHVNGNIKAVLNGVTDGGAGIWDMDYDSNTDEIGYDVAELFESNEEVEPGDVLVVGENGKLEKCKSSNSTKVAGIVSSAPAILFEGSTLEIAPEPFSFQKGYKPPLTVAGRVLCNVSSENGPIVPGDLLVTSSTPGYAMKATDPKIGTVVGKALEPLKEEKGKILVLVCLM